jgi:hypothetical protein
MLVPPGFSVLVGGTAEDAAEQMRRAFPDPQTFAKLHAASATVGSATVAAIRAAGYHVQLLPTTNFPNHGRIVHPDPAMGFADDSLQQLAQAFMNTSTPGS